MKDWNYGIFTFVVVKQNNFEWLELAYRWNLYFGMDEMAETNGRLKMVNTYF